MTQPQFGEPWEAEFNTGDSPGYVKHVEFVDSQGKLISFQGEPEDGMSMPQASLQRVLACVNFLAGVPTEDLQIIMATRPEHRERAAFDLGCVAEALRRYKGLHTVSSKESP